MQVRDKLKNLLRMWPANALAVTTWLEKQHVSIQLCRHWLKLGILNTLPIRLW